MGEQMTLQAVEDHEAELERKRQEQDAAIEKERIEQVFGLTGGELETSPWKCQSRENPELSIDREWSFAYWYEGVPEYAKRDFEDPHDGCHRTVVTECVFGAPPAVLEDEDGRWYRVQSYSSSGETQCSWEGCEDAEENLPCKICEGEDEHGCIYLGEGWCEVVYTQDPVREVMET